MSTLVENLVQRLHARPSGKGWLAKCPAHDDREPSLTIDEGADGRALPHCHAGCGTASVLAALGLTARDLFPASGVSTGNGETPSASKPRSASILNWPVGLLFWLIEHRTDLVLNSIFPTSFAGRTGTQTKMEIEKE